MQHGSEDIPVMLLLRFRVERKEEREMKDRHIIEMILILLILIILVAVFKPEIVKVLSILFAFII